MKWPAPAKTIPPIVGLTLLLCAFVLYHAFRAPPDAASTPITSQVYVWQRSWSDNVEASVRQHGPAFQRIVILTRQISWENGAPKLFRVAVDWPALRSTTAQIGAAIRIGSYAGPYEGPTAEFLAQTIRDLRAEAVQNQVTLAEIQLDFDASTSRLAGYRQWLQSAKPAAAEIPLAITTLPSWLDSPEFAPLVRAAGLFVLQVHGLDKPQKISDPLVLCDPAAARKAIAKAGRIGAPFRVALPTYGYAVAFDPASGNYLGMVAEGAPPDWAQGKSVRLAEANPAELAALVRELTAAHPDTLQGILWYRLPNDSDRLNWRWPTLSAVIKGRTPEPAQLTVKLDKSAGTHGTTADITLVNNGQRDTDAPCRITISWPAATLESADALGDFQLNRDAAHKQITLISPGGFPLRLRAGESRPVGWLRISEDQELTSHVD